MNKKTVIYLAVALVIGTAVNVFAEAATDKTWSVTMGAEQIYGSSGRPTLSIKPSTGVFLYLDSVTAAGKGYLCASKHNAGTKAYATSSVSTKISMTDLLNGAVPGTMPSMNVNLDEPTWTGWTTN